MSEQQSDWRPICATPLAEELDEGECEQLASIVEYRRLKDREILIEEGATDDTLHVILEGTLAVIRRTGGDDEVLLHRYLPGDMVGELGFIDGTAHSATVRAEGPVTTFALHRDAFEKMVTGHPLTAYKVMKSIIRTVHAIVRRMNVQYVEMTNYITHQHGKY